MISSRLGEHYPAAGRVGYAGVAETVGFDPTWEALISLVKAITLSR